MGCCNSGGCESKEALQKSNDIQNNSVPIEGNGTNLWKISAIVLGTILVFILILGILCATGVIHKGM